MSASSSTSKMVSTNGLRPMRLSRSSRRVVQREPAVAISRIDLAYQFARRLRQFRCRRSGINRASGGLLQPTASAPAPRSGSEREAVELGDVAARDPEAIVRAGLLEVAGDDLLRMGPRRSLVRVVRGPHQLVDADKVAVGHADVVVDVGAVHLAPEVLAGLEPELEARRGAAELEGEGHALQVVRQPAAVVLGRDDLELREPVEHAREDEHAEGALDLVREDRGPHVAVAEAPLALPAHARDRVQADRRAELLGAGPERIVDLRAVGLLGGRRAPDHRAPQAQLHAALELRGARLGLVERDHGQAGHALRRVAAVRGEPVVVDAEALLLKPGVLEPEDTEAERRVEHVRLDAVPLVILETLARIPSSRPRIGVRALREKLRELLGRLAGGQADADRMRLVAFVEEVGALVPGRVHDQARRAVAVAAVDAFGP